MQAAYELPLPIAPFRITPYARYEQRHGEFVDFASIVVDRVTAGVNVGIGENLQVKAEYLVNRELEGAPTVRQQRVHIVGGVDMVRARNAPRRGGSARRAVVAALRVLALAAPPARRRGGQTQPTGGGWATICRCRCRSRRRRTSASSRPPSAST